MYLGSQALYIWSGLGCVFKVILLANGSRFAYRTTIVTILLWYLFFTCFSWKKLYLCVAQNGYELKCMWMRNWVCICMNGHWVLFEFLGFFLGIKVDVNMASTWCCIREWWTSATVYSLKYLVLGMVLCSRSGRVGNSFSSTGETCVLYDVFLSLAWYLISKNAMFYIKLHVNFRVFGTHRINILHMLSTPNIDDITM